MELPPILDILTGQTRQERRMWRTIKRVNRSQTLGMRTRGLKLLTVDIEGAGFDFASFYASQHSQIVHTIDHATLISQPNGNGRSYSIGELQAQVEELTRQMAELRSQMGLTVGVSSRGFGESDHPHVRLSGDENFSPRP